VIAAELWWPGASHEQAAAAAAGAARLGDRFELHPIAVAYPHLREVLRSSAPAVLAAPQGLLAVARVGRRHAMVVTPDGRRRRLSTEALISAVAADVETPVAAEAARLPLSVRRALLDARLADRRVDPGWRVLPQPSASLRVLIRTAHLGAWALAVVISHALVYTVFLAIWAVIGGAAAGGRLTGAVVAAGLALLVVLVPLRMLATWSAGVFTVQAGTLLKRRLLGGVLGLDTDEMRHRGAGQLLGVVLEAEALETLALTGGYAGLLAVGELAAATVALASGSRSGVLLTLLIAWVALAAVLTRAYLARRRVWSRTRLALTHDLVERMTGHRTRLVQEGPGLFDLAPDRAAHASYDQQATGMDRVAAVLNAAVPRGWMIASLVALILPLPQDANPVQLAAAIGGVLLAFHGLDKLTYGLAQLADAAVAWDRVGPLAHHRADAPAGNAAPSSDGTVQAHAVSYAYNRRHVLRGVSLSVQPGDRILLQGPSGAGKSTLAAVLAGLRAPSHGTVIGAQQVTVAPQFHENYLVSASLAFNLLLGRRWPPTTTDLREAQTLCEELGLGPLLTDMPAGLAQPVGEVGWQLSHGERSRVYVARALLSDATVVVLDESFAALDPKALHQTLDCVVRRTPALIVITHE
jgi:ATP-binding cassette subfamily B protein